MNNELKHTPGPWTANSADNIYALVGARQEMIARVLDLPCLGGNDDASAMRAREQEKANARLIAAAPDMLDALKELSAMYSHTWDLVDGGLVMLPHGIKRFEMAHGKAQAAIAKAEVSA